MSRQVRKALENFESSLTSNRVFFAIAAVMLITGIAAIVITILNANYYWGTYDFCTRIECFREIAIAFDVQIELIKAGAAIAAFVAIILGAFVALRDYLSSKQVGAFGNRISHVALFERFVATELQRRKRLTPRCVDIYAIYQLMFPKTNADARFASDAFNDVVQRIYAAVSESTLEYKASKDFVFERHRRRMISAVSEMHIQMDGMPRVDFLDVEDEVLDFIRMLCLSFAAPGYDVTFPQRNYR